MSVFLCVCVCCRIQHIDEKETGEAREEDDESINDKRVEQH